MTSPMTSAFRRHATKITWAAIAVTAVALLVIARSLPLAQGVEALRRWVEGLGVWGPVAFGAVYAAATVLFVPGLVLTLAAGAIFGLAVGLVTVSLASTTGAALAFLVARYLARDRVAELARRRPGFGAVDRAIGEGGWKIVALLRLSPAIPFNVQNYLYGLTPIGFWPCVLTSWIAMLPGTFLYVYVGHLTGAAVGGSRERTAGEWAALVVGLLATVAVTVYVTRLARAKLAEQTEIEAAAPAEQAEHVPAERGPAAEAESRGAWETVAAVVVALLAVGLASWVSANRGAVAGLFGPPRARLAEAYEREPGGPSFDHSAFDALLREHVAEGGWVDYRGLGADQAALDAYISRLGGAPFDALGRDEKLALLINAYNAFTLKLILEHYPLASIKDIPEDRRWDDERWRVGENLWSLNQIEHREIRPRFAEPRIHFALVCAAVGCPPLRRDAYTAERLEIQLEEQAVYVHTDPRWLRWEPDRAVLHLTSLYDWYGSDFAQVAGSMLEFVARYSAPLAQTLAAGRRPEIRWIDYDWSLNGLENRPGP